MKKVQRAYALGFLVPLFAAPSLALAFEAVDTLPFPSRGDFPAYPAEAARPTTVWGQAGYRRDDNVLRSETNEQSENIFRIGAGFRTEQRVIGRQRLVVEGRGDYYSYDRFDDLDHFAYGLLGDWQWEVGNNLSGSILLGRERRQADISETQSTTRDLVTATRLGATAAYLLTPRFRLRGGVAAAKAERDAAAEAETSSGSLSAAGEYVSALGNTLGIEFRTTSGDAPVPEFVAPLGTFVNNDYREREWAFVVGYALGPQLRGGLRLGRTKREYTELQGRDFDGSTGRVFVEWLPGNKTILGFEAYKLPQSIIDVAAGHVVVKGVSFGPRWAATSKLVFSGRLLRERRTFEGDPSLTAGTPLRDEDVSLIRLAVGWEPQRHWEVGLGVDFGERESNFAGRDYKYTSVSTNVAYRW